MTNTNTENNLNMVISEMDSIKDNLLFNKVCSNNKKLDKLNDRMNTLEDKLNLIIKMLGDNNG